MCYLYICVCIARDVSPVRVSPGVLLRAYILVLKFRDNGTVFNHGCINKVCMHVRMHVGR